MDKPFKTLDEQVELLRRRGMGCGSHAQLLLLREGYYAVVNGYRLPFLDPAASGRAGDDRFLPGTSLDDVHALFCFDRELRAATFFRLMSIEGLMRSVLSYVFCNRHRQTEAYLRPQSYSRQRDYLRGEASFEGDLEWMINTLEHRARGVEAQGGAGATASPERRDARPDARVAHYQQNHDGVPLWVLFNELTFGNLKYFYALMRREEQEEATGRLWEACERGGTSPLTRKGVFHDLEELVAVRNTCAHGERLYDYASEETGHRSYRELLGVMGRYLTPAEEAKLRSEVEALAKRYLHEHPRLERALVGVALGRA